MMVTISLKYAKPEMKSNDITKINQIGSEHHSLCVLRQ